MLREATTPQRWAENALRPSLPITTADRHPSNLASIGRYVLTPDIIALLRALAPGAGGEIQFADAINIQASKGGVDYVTLSGTRYDCGSVNGYLDAITAVANARREGG